MLDTIKKERGERGVFMSMSQVEGLAFFCLPQDASHLRGALAGLAQEAHIGESLFKAIRRKLDFDRVPFEKNLSVLSGGQKKGCCWPKASASRRISICGTSR